MAGGAVSLIFWVVPPVSRSDTGSAGTVRAVVHVEDLGVGSGMGHLGLVPVAGHLYVAAGTGRRRDEPVGGVVSPGNRVEKNLSGIAHGIGHFGIVEPAVLAGGYLKAFYRGMARRQFKHPLPIGERIILLPCDPHPGVGHRPVLRHDPAAYFPAACDPGSRGGIAESG